MECARAEKSCQKVLEAVRAVEMHMALPCIAMRIYRALLSAKTFFRFLGKQLELLTA